MMKEKTSVTAAAIITCLASPPILAKDPEGLAVGRPALRSGGGPQNIKTPNATQSLIPVANNAAASIVQPTPSNAAPKTVIMLSLPPSTAQGNGPSALIQLGAPGSVSSLQQVGASSSGPGSAPSPQVGGSVGPQATPNFSASTPQASPSGAAGAGTPITPVNAGPSNTAPVGTGAGGGEVLTNSGSGSSGPSLQTDAVVRPQSQSPSHSSNSSADAGGAQSKPSLNGANAASSVSNSGTAGSGNASNPVITTSQGEVLLAAGKSVELVDPGTPELRVEVTAPENQALNLGKIIADSGRKGIFAGLASRGDVSRAEHAVVTSDGRVLLRSTQNIAPTTGETGAAGGAVRNNAAGSSGKNAEPMRVASSSPQGATSGRAANDGNSGGNPHTTGASQSKGPRKVDLQADALLRSESSQGNSYHGGSSQGEGSLGQASQGSSAHGSDSKGGSSQGSDSQGPAPQANGEPFQRPAAGSDADEAKIVAAEQKQSSGATAAESAGRKSNVCS